MIIDELVGHVHVCSIVSGREVKLNPQRLKEVPDKPAEYRGAKYCLDCADYVL